MSTNTISCSFPSCASPALYSCKLCYNITCWCPSHVKNHDSIASHSKFEEVFTTLNSSDYSAFASSIVESIKSLNNLKAHAAQVYQKETKNIKTLFKQTNSEIDKTIALYNKTYIESKKNPVILSEIYKKISFVSKKNEKLSICDGPLEKFEQKVDEIYRKLKKYSLNLSAVEKFTDEKYSAMTFLHYGMVSADFNYLQYVCTQLNAKANIGAIKIKCKICNNYIEDDKNIKSLCKGLVHKACVKNLGQYAVVNNIVSINFNCVTCFQIHGLVTRNIQMCQYCCRCITYFKDDLNVYCCLNCISLMEYESTNFHIYKIISKFCQELLGNQNDLCYLCSDFAELFLNNTKHICYPCGLKMFRNHYSTIINSNLNETFSALKLSSNYLTIQIKDINPLISVQINDLKESKKIALKNYVR